MDDKSSLSATRARSYLYRQAEGRTCPSRDKTLVWMTQDALPASTSSRSPGKSRAAGPATGQPREAHREARFASAAPKFPPPSLRNHNDVGCIGSGIGVCYFPGRNAIRPSAPGTGQRPDWRPDLAGTSSAGGTVLFELPGMERRTRRRAARSDIENRTDSMRRRDRGRSKQTAAMETGTGPRCGSTRHPSFSQRGGT
jgi:hypothetical protein